jgi:hypothetical protein
MSELVLFPEEVNLVRALRGTPNAAFSVMTNEYGKIRGVKVEQVLTETIIIKGKIRTAEEVKAQGA